jgi:hypothetical protein
MKATSMKIVVLSLIAQFVFTMTLSSCLLKRSDGSNGSNGTNGANGSNGSDGTNGGDGFYLPDDLTFAITASSIGASTATLQFTAEDSFGKPYNRFSQSDVTDGYLIFFLAQLTPPVASGDTAQWKNYKSDAVTAPGVASPTYDKTGTLTLIDSAAGKYSYTFSFNPHTVSSPVSVTYNADYTHRVAIQTAYSGREAVVGTPNIIVKSDTFDFVPSGHSVDGITTVTKAMAATSNCTQCHAELPGHNNYNNVNVCVLCHNPGANIGDSVNYDMSYMVHAIHSYNTKRTAPWRGPLNTGYTGSATEEVGLPQSSGNCSKCHHSDTLSNGEAPTGVDGDNWKNVPTMKACTACHNTVDFTVASTHKAPTGTINGGVQTSNRNCSVCHYTSMIEAYHSSSSIGSAHKPGASVGTWEKGIITYPRISYEISSATVDGGGNLSIDFAVKADGVIINLLDATGTGNNVRFATSYSVPSVKKSAATADSPYTKYAMPSAPIFYLAFAADQGSITAANAVDWNNIGNGSAGAGQPLTVSLLRLGMRYWAQPYDGAATPVTSAMALVPCLGDVRQTDGTLSGCGALGASGAPTVITGENINLGSLTPRYSGPTLIGFTAAITFQTVTALNSSWKSSGTGSTLVHTYSQVYPYPAGAKLRAVALGGSMKWDNGAIAYSTPSGTAYTTNLVTITTESIVKGVTGDNDRRTVVDPDKCAKCHEVLSMHGGSRVYQPRLCSMCHNAGFSSTGKIYDLDNPIDSIHLKNFIHGIHGSEKRETPLYFTAGTNFYSYPSNTLSSTLLTAFDSFISANNGVTWSKDSTVAAVALANSKTLMSFPGKPQNCLICHIASTSTEDATYGIGAVPTNALESTQEIDPDTSGGAAASSRDSYTYGRFTYPHNGDLTTKPISASCRGCHDGAVARVHMEQNGGKVLTARNATQVGGAESCILCHGPGRMVDADVQHGVQSSKAGSN